MEGDRLITLREPPVTEKDEYGQSVVTAQGTGHRVWASRKDLRGDETDSDQVQVRETHTQFLIRIEPGRFKPTSAWTLEDENGTVYDIESVSEDTFRHPHRPRWWRIIATARA